jgi:hypothetical protein
MKHRFIAGVLLLSLVSWANSAAFCLSGLSTMATHVASMVGITHATHSQQHACCPKIAAKPAADNWTPSLPSDHGHRCCFVQNPQIPSNLPGGTTENRSPHGLAVAYLNVPGPSTAALPDSAILQVQAFRSPSTFSSVLRI